MAPVRHPEITRSTPARLLWLALLLGAHACAAAGEAEQPAGVNPAVEVLALSRGRGVPKAATEALHSIVRRLEAAREAGEIVDMEQSTIGLEGETRLCVWFRDRDALAALRPELQRMSAGIDLLQLRENGCARER